MTSKAITLLGHSLYAGQWIRYSFHNPTDFGWEFLAMAKDARADQLLIERAKWKECFEEGMALGAFLFAVGAENCSEPPRVIALPDGNNSIVLHGFTWKVQGGSTHMLLRQESKCLMQALDPFGPCFDEVTFIVGD